VNKILLTKKIPVWQLSAKQGENQAFFIKIVNDKPVYNHLFEGDYVFGRIADEAVDHVEKSEVGRYFLPTGKIVSWDTKLKSGGRLVNVFDKRYLEKKNLALKEEIIQKVDKLNERQLNRVLEFLAQDDSQMVNVEKWLLANGCSFYKDSRKYGTRIKAMLERALKCPIPCEVVEKDKGTHKEINYVWRFDKNGAIWKANRTVEKG